MTKSELLIARKSLVSNSMTLEGGHLLNCNMAIAGIDDHIHKQNMLAIHERELSALLTQIGIIINKPS